MSAHKIWRLAEDVLSNRSRTASPAAASIGRSLKSGATEVICYTIQASHDVIYWKLHLQALEVALYKEGLSGELIQRISISYLFAASVDPGASISQFGKHYGILMTILQLTVL